MVIRVFALSGRYRNRVEFRGIDLSVMALMACSRYRNRVEFRDYQHAL